MKKKKNKTSFFFFFSYHLPREFPITKLELETT